MTKFLKYTTKWIGRTTIFCNGLKYTTEQIGRTTICYNDKIPQYTTEWIGRITIFCYGKMSQIYYRTDW